VLRPLRVLAKQADVAFAKGLKRQRAVLKILSVTNTKTHLVNQPDSRKTNASNALESPAHPYVARYLDVVNVELSIARIHGANE